MAYYCQDAAGYKMTIGHSRRCWQQQFETPEDIEGYSAYLSWIDTHAETGSKFNGSFSTYKLISSGLLFSHFLSVRFDHMKQVVNQLKSNTLNQLVFKPTFYVISVDGWCVIATMELDLT